MQVGEQLCKQVLRHDADVGLDVVVEDEARREGGLVLPAPPCASPAGTARVRGWHCVRLGAGVKQSGGRSVAEGRRCIRGREERGCSKGDAVTGAVAGAARFRVFAKAKSRYLSQHQRSRSMIDVQAAATQCAAYNGQCQDWEDASKDSTSKTQCSIPNSRRDG